MKAYAALVVASFVSLISTEPLYSVTDPYINILDRSNFTQFLANEIPADALPTATWIKYYLSWCGHCIRFSPMFKQLALDVQDWSSVIKLAVVDCSDERNQELCKEYDTRPYPNMRYYSPSFKTIRDYSQDKPADFDREKFPRTPDVVGYKYNGTREGLSNLRAGMIESLVMNCEKNPSNIPAHWPDLLPKTAASKSELVKTLAVDENIPIILVVEPQTSVAGVETILDHSAWQDKVKIFRVTDQSQELVKELLPQGYSGQPTLLELQRDGSNSVKLLCCGSKRRRRAIPTEEYRSRFKQIIRESYLPDVAATSTTTTTTETPPSTTPNNTNALKPVLPVYSVDLENSLRYSIYNQVKQKSTFNDKQLSALKNFLDVVDAYFPSTDVKPHNFVKVFKRWVETRNSSITANDLENGLNGVEKNFTLPEMQAWKGCAGSEPRYRGYPCSLWTLFHVLTVNEYLKESSNSNNATLASHSVLPAMKGFIFNFFGCAECVENFAKESLGMEDVLAKAKEETSVLWLWRTHNSVNKRLAGDATEDPQNPKVIFPPHHACNDCYKKGSTSDFDEGETLKYLVNRYKSDSIVSDSSVEKTQRKKRLSRRA